MVSIKKNDKLLPSGIELSDAPQSRTRNNASTSRPEQTAVVDDIETGRGESPAIVVKKGLSTKQKLGLGALGLLGVSGLAATAAVAGVQTRKNHTLQRQNNLLNVNLKKADASVAMLQSQINSGSAAAAVIPGPATPPPFYAPPPPPPPGIDQIRAQFNESETVAPVNFVNQLAASWNMSDPAIDVMPIEQEQIHNLTYVDTGLTLFGGAELPSFNQIQINGGFPAAHAMGGSTTGTEAMFMAESLGAAAGAIAAVNPEYLGTYFTRINSSNVFGVQMPFYFQTRANPFGFQPVMLTAKNTLLSDNDTYARGTNPLRVLEDNDFNFTESGLQPNAALWFPLLQKVAAKVNVEVEDAYFLEGDLSEVGGALQAMTGQVPESRDLSRFGDLDAQFELDTSADPAGLTQGVLQALPSKTFDANIAHLYNSLQRAATFTMRAGYQIGFFPNATNSSSPSAHFDGMFFEQALGGLHIHAKTDDGAVNEIFFANRPYVWLGVSTDERTGDLSNVTLLDMSGATIDCDSYDETSRFQAFKYGGGESEWGVYGANQTVLNSLTQVNGEPSLWTALPLKQAEVTVPYKMFKQLAEWTDQVDVPVAARTDSALYAPTAIVPQD